MKMLFAAVHESAAGTFASLSTSSAYGEEQPWLIAC